MSNNQIIFYRTKVYQTNRMLFRVKKKSYISKIYFLSNSQLLLVKERFIALRSARCKKKLHFSFDFSRIFLITQLPCDARPHPFLVAEKVSAGCAAGAYEHSQIGKSELAVRRWGRRGWRRYANNKNRPHNSHQRASAWGGRKAEGWRVGGLPELLISTLGWH